MRIAAIQIKPKKGLIEENILAHVHWIRRAISVGIDAVFFPELSITGYEPEIAKKLKVELEDSRFNVFQKLCDQESIAIGVGAPMSCNEGDVQIGMLFFQKEEKRMAYSKQILHEDEFPFFVEGQEQKIFGVQSYKIAPAICYESLQEKHLTHAIDLKANFYLSSVAKPQKGVERAKDYFPKVAEKYGVPIMMVNCVGFCDNFLSVGQSSVWDEGGNLIGQLDAENEGFLVYDTVKNEVIEKQ